MKYYKVSWIFEWLGLPVLGPLLAMLLFVATPTDLSLSFLCNLKGYNKDSTLCNCSRMNHVTLVISFRSWLTVNLGTKPGKLFLRMSKNLAP